MFPTLFTAYTVEMMCPIWGVLTGTCLNGCVLTRVSFNIFTTVLVGAVDCSAFADSFSNSCPYHYAKEN